MSDEMTHTSVNRPTRDYEGTSNVLFRASNDPSQRASFVSDDGMFSNIVRLPSLCIPGFIFQAEISVQSPRKLFIFVIFNKKIRIKVP